MILIENVPQLSLAKSPSKALKWVIMVLSAQSHSKRELQNVLLLINKVLHHLGWFEPCKSFIQDMLISTIWMGAFCGFSPSSLPSEKIAAPKLLIFEVAAWSRKSMGRPNAASGQWREGPDLLPGKSWQENSRPDLGRFMKHRGWFRNQGIFLFTAHIESFMYINTFEYSFMCYRISMYIRVCHVTHTTTVILWGNMENISLPETNMEYDRFLLGPGQFSRANMLVLGSVWKYPDYPTGVFKNPQRRHGIVGSNINITRTSQPGTWWFGSAWNVQRSFHRLDSYPLFTPGCWLITTRTVLHFWEGIPPINA